MDSVRIAMRVQMNGETDQVYYLLMDHNLAAQDSGSTMMSSLSDGQETGTQSYKPWEEPLEPRLEAGRAPEVFV